MIENQEIKNHVPIIKEKNISQNKLLDDLKSVAKKYNRNTLSMEAYEKEGKFSRSPFKRKFGSWNNALEKAGLTIKNQKKISEDELFRNIEVVWDKLGRQPRQYDFDTPTSKFSSGTYKKRFKTYNNALRLFANWSNPLMEQQTKVGLYKLTADASTCLAKSENENIEFKSTLCWNILKKLKDEQLEEEVLKTIVAFNNTDGGTLFIGVDDNGNILGLNNDYIFAGLVNADKFQLHLRSVILGRLILPNKSYLIKNIKFAIIKKDDKEMCVVKVAKGDKPIFTNKDIFYVRIGNSTHKLENYGRHEYLKKRFPN